MIHFVQKKIKTQKDQNYIYIYITSKLTRLEPDTEKKALYST